MTARTTTLLSSAEAHFARGEVLALVDRWAEAAEAFEAAVAAQHCYPEAWSRLGVMRTELGDLDDALACLDRSLQQRPDDAAALTNFGSVLWKLDRPAEAVTVADRALALNPACWQAAVLQGNALRAQDRVAEALEAFEIGLRAAPNAVQLRLNRALCLLLAGDFERGWQEYEWRWRTPNHSKRERIYEAPLWCGQDPVGKTILLHPEQGLGDTLQFCRYAPLVAALGATVVFAASPEMHGLMTSLAGVSLLVSTSESPPPFDLQCPLLSLPLALGTTAPTIPAPRSYLAASSPHRQKWRARLGPRVRPRIGVAWAGNPGHGNDRHRSLTLDAAVSMLPDGADIICLQRDLRPADVPALAMRPDIAFFGPDLAEFADTAALACELDLVITVDTAILHLAGALGLPVWGLIPTSCDWRWMIGRDDSPWYPTLRLFRQPGPGQWGPMLARVKREAENWLAEDHH